MTLIANLKLLPPSNLSFPEAAQFNRALSVSTDELRFSWATLEKIISSEFYSKAEIVERNRGLHFNGRNLQDVFILTVLNFVKRITL